MQPRDALVGLSYIPRAAQLLATTPELRKFLVIPVLASLAVGLALYGVLLAVGFFVVGLLTTGLTGWLATAVPVLQIVLGVLLFLAVGWTVGRFGVIIGSPWYGQLAEELEHKLLPFGEVPDAPEGFRAMALDIGLAVAYELKKLVLVVVAAPFLIVLGFVPAVGPPLATLGWVSLAVLTLVLDFLDPALQRRRLKFRQKLVVVLADLPAHATFGAVSLFLVGIPVLNFVAVPLCMTAGALLYCERHHERVKRITDPKLNALAPPP